MSTDKDFKGINFMSKATYDGQSTHAEDEVFMVEQPEATTLQKGVVQLATSAETTAGTLDTKAVTPAGLKTVTSTLATTGAVTSAVSTHNSSTTAHSTLFANKQDIRTTVTDTTSTEITLADVVAGTDYEYGTLTALTVSAYDTSYTESTITFTAGDTITVTLPSTLKQIGAEVTFEASTKYTMSIWNGMLLVGVVG